MHQLTRFVLSTLLLGIPLMPFADEPEPAQVMLFGVFHFANPGLDVVKTDQINVMTEGNQAYLEALAGRIAEFNPTIVLLEYGPDIDAKIQGRFRQFVDGSYELPSNEIYQLGFRIAALSDADTVYGYDESSVHWQAEPLFEYLKNTDPETNAKLSALIEKSTHDMQDAHARLSLGALLARGNDPDQDAENRGFYIITNHVGDEDNYVGADATASWWHRNFRMYANIQRHARPGERVLAIGGYGHTAILRQLLADDPEREAVDVRPFLSATRAHNVATN